MQNNDAMGALNHFAAFSGMKPYEFQESLITSLAPEVVRRANMSEEQLRAEKLRLRMNTYDNNKSLNKLSFKSSNP